MIQPFHVKIAAQRRAFEANTLFFSIRPDKMTVWVKM